MRWVARDYFSVSDCGYKVSVAGDVYVAWAPGKSDYGGMTPLGFFREGAAEDRVAAAMAECEKHWGLVNGEVD